MKPGVQVIAPNPKSSGAAQLAFLAAWSYAEHEPGGSDKAAQGFVSKLYHNVPVLDSERAWFHHNVHTPWCRRCSDRLGKRSASCAEGTARPVRDRLPVLIHPRPAAGCRRDQECPAAWHRSRGGSISASSTRRKRKRSKRRISIVPAIRMSSQNSLLLSRRSNSTRSSRNSAAGRTSKPNSSRTAKFSIRSTNPVANRFFDQARPLLPRSGPILLITGA